MNQDLVTTTQIVQHIGVIFKPEIIIEQGVKPAERAKNGYKWHQKDVPAIVEAICKVITERAAKPVDTSIGHAKGSTAMKIAKENAQKVIGPKSGGMSGHDPLNDDDDDPDAL